MVTDLEHRVVRLREDVDALEGRLPKNASIKSGEGHVHRISAMIDSPPGVYVKHLGRPGGQIVRGDTASSGTLTLYGGTTDASTLSRIIIGSDAKFATASVIWRNASDQSILEQVSGNPGVIFPGDINANANIKIGTFGGSQATIRKVTQSVAPALTWGNGSGAPGRLMPIPFAGAANVTDDILADRTGTTRVFLNSAPLAGGAHVGFIGNIAATGSKAGNLLVYEDKTDAILVKKTASAPVKTGTGTGQITLMPTDFTLAGNTAYRVEIDFAGTEATATYRWSDTGGGVWNASGVALTGGINALNNNVQFVVSQAGTFDLGDRWDWTQIGTANQVELIRADTTTDTLFLRNVWIEATTSTHTSNLVSLLKYTGTSASTFATQLSATLQNTGAGAQSIVSVKVGAFADRTAAGTITEMVALYATVESTANQTGPITLAVASRIGSTWDGTSPANVVGLQITNMNGSAAVGTVTALEIGAQEAGATATYNIRQMGTTGVNRFGAPTLIGADASPAAGMALELRDDLLMAGNLIYGNTSSAGNLALSSTSHATKGRIILDSILRMAASTNNYIEDSAGNRHITFASSTTVVAVTTSVAGDLRVNDQLGVGGAVNLGARVLVTGWVSDVGTTGALIRANFDGILGGNVTTRAGFEFLGVAVPSFDIAGFNITGLYGVKSDPQIADSVGVTGVVSQHAAYYGRSRYGGGGGADILVTDTGVFIADVPDFLDSGLSVITRQRGFWAKNQGATGVVDAIGVDIEAQSGASGLNIGLRLNANFAELAEMTAPAAPAANGCRIWAEDNGSGKTRLIALFSSGAAQQIAIQP